MLPWCYFRTHVAALSEVVLDGCRKPIAVSKGPFCTWPCPGLPFLSLGHDFSTATMQRRTVIPPARRLCKRGARWALFRLTHANWVDDTPYVPERGNEKVFRTLALWATALLAGRKKRGRDMLALNTANKLFVVV